MKGKKGMIGHSTERKKGGKGIRGCSMERKKWGKDERGEAWKGKGVEGKERIATGRKR